jgi:hypothetical protein
MSNQDPFVTITDQLASAHGGISMRLTQYGYPHDPDGDSETRKGHGAYRHLQAGASIKLKGGGTLTRRIDDRAPERGRRADLYQPGGFNRQLPDYADVTRHRG